MVKSQGECNTSKINNILIYKINRKNTQGEEKHRL